MKNNNSTVRKIKELEIQNNLLKHIIHVQKRTINRLINQFIMNDSTNTKDNA